jgi:predicted transcriptional regulator
VSKREEKLLTEVELELMALLWKRGEGSVSDVLAELPKDRKLAYTSVSTILRILEQKGVVSTRKEGRGHVYVPRLSKAAYEKRALKHVVARVFDGAPVALVKQLLNSDIGAEDLEEIKKLIEARAQ